jgi:hypothetical protein
VADEGDGLVAVLVDDELECFSHAGDDVMPGLAVRDSLLQVVLNDPGAEHLSCLPAHGTVAVDGKIVWATLSTVG